MDAGFTSRSGELERVLAVLDPEAEGVPGVVVSQGMGGVGKTQLALAAGHEALRRGWFAGALFVNLHGYTTPVDGDRAVESFLRGLDVPPRRWPDDAEARRGCTGRRWRNGPWNWVGRSWWWPTTPPRRGRSPPGSRADPTPVAGDLARPAHLARLAARPHRPPSR
ncbi:ATP-binding protein [Nocardiopsis eucommiae]|uniref:ATP-binding protein n=1 Tax=Nocardiopsis eucommiae TaxID=2831970 RepID=A0A975L6C9_9ACTN|nr:ATP-binding protein [Nocardiopsis eucommiae]